MGDIKSKRAKELLLRPHSYQTRPLSQLRKYPGSMIDFYGVIELEGKNVKNLSFAGNLPDHMIVLIESAGEIMKNRSIDLLDSLSLRECEAYLRDKNSQAAIENLDSEDDESLKKILYWLKRLPREMAGGPYEFSSEKGRFADLKLVDKVRELKAFLASFEVQSLYSGRLGPELVDVDGLMVFVSAPYSSSEEKGLFEELHLLAVATYQDENINFIPEA